MAKLIHCKTCGHQVAKSAKACPGCGAKVKGTSILAKLALGFILLMFFAALASDPNKPSEPSSSSTSTGKTTPSAPVKPKPKERAMQITSNKLIAAYKSNEVAADEIYKGKLLQVTGEVGSIKKDILDNLYVTLKSDERFSFVSVQCYFTKAFTKRLTKLKKGQKLTVTGRCKGLMGTISIKDCIIN